MTPERRRKRKAQRMADKAKARGFKSWLHKRCDEMRSDPTEAEAILIQALRDAGAKNFVTQHPFDRFILDIYFPAVGLIVEVDGGYHSLKSQQRKDAKRTKILRNAMREVIRFTNEEVLDPDRLPLVVRAIKQKVMTMQPIWKSFKQRQVKWNAMMAATALRSAEECKDDDDHMRELGLQARDWNTTLPTEEDLQ